jgi:hypothetical protein
MLYRNISIVIVLFSWTFSSAYSDHYNVYRVSDNYTVYRVSDHYTIYRVSDHYTVYRASDHYTTYRVIDHYTVYRASVGQTEKFPHFHQFCVSYIQPINSSFIHVRVARYAYSVVAVLM